jgi:hypothetical protein
LEPTNLAMRRLGLRGDKRITPFLLGKSVTGYLWPNACREVIAERG